MDANLELPPRPQEPDPQECCNRGCERCIYVYYYEALEKWEQRIEAIKAAQGQMACCSAQTPG
jgi:hypothetical protein